MLLHRLGLCVFNKMTTFASGVHAPSENLAIPCSFSYGPERNILKCNTHLESKKSVSNHVSFVAFVVANVAQGPYSAEGLLPQGL